MDLPQEQAPPIRIVWGDGFISVEPTVPPILTEKLKYWHRSTEYDYATYQRVTTGEYKQLYTVQSVVAPDLTISHKLITMPGFLFKIKKLLEEQGIKFSITDGRTPPPVPNYENAVALLRPFQVECVVTMLMSGGGMISCPTGWGKTYIMAAVISAFSQEALKLRGTPLTVVAGPDKDIMRKNWIELKKVLPDRDVGLIMSGVRKPSDDVQVITLDSLQHLNADDVGVLIVDEVHAAATGGRSDKLLGFRYAARWGVSATPTGRFDGADIVNEGVFGPIVYTRTYQQGVADGQLVPIKVCWVRMPEPEMGLDKYLNYSSRKGRYNQAVYLNKTLNAMIVRILKQTPKDDHQVLCIMQFLDQMNRIMEFAVADKYDIKYVHGTTSADEILKEGYKNLTAINKAERQAIYDQMSAGTIRQILSTHVYKQGVNFPNLDVVINASGGGSELLNKQIPGRGSRKTVDKDLAYIVDFWHPWDTEDKDGKQIPGPVFRDDKQREKFYAQLGFDQVWVDTVDQLPFVIPQNLKTEPPPFRLKG